MTNQSLLTEALQDTTTTAAATTTTATKSPAPPAATKPISKVESTDDDDDDGDHNYNATNENHYHQNHNLHPTTTTMSATSSLASSAQSNKSNFLSNVNNNNNHHLLLLHHDSDHDHDDEQHHDDDSEIHSMLPRHSDFTIPTSNHQLLFYNNNGEKHDNNPINKVKMMTLQPPPSLSVIALGQSDITLKHTNQNHHESSSGSGAGDDHHHSSSTRRTTRMTTRKDNHKTQNNYHNNYHNHHNNGSSSTRKRGTHGIATTNSNTDGHGARRNIFHNVGTRYGTLNCKRQKPPAAASPYSDPTSHSSTPVASTSTPVATTATHESPVILDPSPYQQVVESIIDVPSFNDVPTSHETTLPTSPLPVVITSSPNPLQSTLIIHAPNDDDGHSSFSSNVLTSDHIVVPIRSSPANPKRPNSRILPRVVPMSLQHTETPPMTMHESLQNHHHGQGNHHGHGHHHHHRTTTTAVHETIHAQSLLLGLAFMAVWTPNNAMAPNLTQMASDTFDMNNTERDLYLGSYCALAVGVFSIPLSGMIGVMADFYSRKTLFLSCVLVGALASAWTGWSHNYWSLFLARLCSGGCMSGSVPVAFSLLGDLFSKEERNAASSGLTAMMGLGILSGQVYAGMTGPKRGWQDVFFFSSILQLMTAAVMALWVKEPIRGAKEKALQNVFQSGNKYERQLTVKGFLHALQRNKTNQLIMWQGFLTSLPWGIVFVFLNDYLSQEKGFSVPEATFIIMLFGVGCAIGGIAGGAFGQMFMKWNRSYLPLYMAAATFFGIFPFLVLFNSEFHNHHGVFAKMLAIVGGFICCLPSVNIRPIIINVNPPETRGASLTAANLLVTLGRGLGPLCIVFMVSFLHTSRQTALNVTVGGFWTISAIELLFLIRTFPRDQDAMEEELHRYATASAPNGDTTRNGGVQRTDLALSPISHSHQVNESTGLLSRLDDSLLHDDGESIVSIEDYMTSFDGTAARRSFQFVRMGIQELKEEITNISHPCHGCEGSATDESDDISRTNFVDAEDHEWNEGILEDDLTEEEILHRRELWLRQQQEH